MHRTGHARDERLRAALRALFWIAAAGAAVMAVLPHPPRLPTDAWGDKFHHVLAFTVLAALAAAGWPRAAAWRMIGWLSLFGAGIEAVQAIPALHRDSDVRDWMADTLAVAAVMAVAALVRRRKGAHR